MKVKQIMTQEVFTCSPSDTLNRAAQIFWENDCGCAPVIDHDRKVVGIVTDRDSLIAAYTQGKSLNEIPVTVAMSQVVQCCRLGDSVSSAERLMREKRVRRLPVIDDDGRLVGILAINDIAQEAAKERKQRRKEVSDAEVGETLSFVCEPRARGEAVGAS